MQTYSKKLKNKDFYLFAIFESKKKIRILFFANFEKLKKDSFIFKLEKRESGKRIKHAVKPRGAKEIGRNNSKFTNSSNS